MMIFRLHILVIFLAISPAATAQQAFSVDPGNESDSIDISDTIHPEIPSVKNFSTLKALLLTLDDALPVDSLFNGQIILLRNGAGKNKNWKLAFLQHRSWNLLSLSIPDEAGNPELKMMNTSKHNLMAGIYYTIHKKHFSRADSTGHELITATLAIWELNHPQMILNQDVVQHMQFIQPSDQGEIIQFRFDLQTGIIVSKKFIELKVTWQKGLKYGAGEEQLRSQQINLRYRRTRNFLYRIAGSSIAY